MPESSGSRESKRAFWRQELELWRERGQSAAAFCRERGLSYATFLYYRRRDKVSAEPAATRGTFVPVPATALGEVRSWCDPLAPIRVRVAGTIIEVGPGFDSSVLRAVVDVLQGRAS